MHDGKTQYKFQLDDLRKRCVLIDEISILSHGKKDRESEGERETYRVQMEVRDEEETKQ